MERRSARRYPRTARLNTLVHEVVAEELELVEDPRLGFVTVTGVVVTSDLGEATVFYTWLPASADGSIAPDRTADEAMLQERDEALEVVSRRIRGALGRQVRMRKVPRLLFREDPGVVAGSRVDEIIRDLHRSDPPGDGGGVEGSLDDRDEGTGVGLDEGAGVEGPAPGAG